MTEIQRLQDRVAELEDALGLTAELPREIIPREMFQKGLSFNRVQAITGMLLRRTFAARSAIFDGIYGGLPEADIPEPKVIDVLVCHVRKVLRRHGVEMRTVIGRGYYLDEENKAKLRAIIAQFEQREQAA